MSPVPCHLPAGCVGDVSFSGRGTTGESTTLSVSGFSSGAGRGSGTSLGGGDAEGMAADCSSSSEEDSDEEDEEEEDDDDEEEEELPLSESDVLPFSPSESAYREHWEDESLSSSSPGNPQGAAVVKRRDHSLSTVGVRL